MLDEGFRAGLEYMGIGHRTICHVEREAHAAAVLVARMEEGSLDAAPIWSDVTTFDAAAWRGKVDCIVAGFPCQDLSVAGRRAGLDGKRSGLFFEVIRIATDSDAWLIVLENVAGISSATASVMDEEEGELEERAAARVVGELADCGWNAEWIVVSASDVGASHGRARWFCFAWRNVADAEGIGRGQRQRDELARRAEAEGAGQSMANAARHVGDRSGDRQSGSWMRVCETGGALDNADSIGAQRSGRKELCADAGCEALGDTESDGWDKGWAESTRQQGRHDVAEHGMPVADASDDHGRRGIGGAQEGIGAERCGRRGFASGRHELADASGTRPQRHKQSSTHEPDGRTDGRTDARTMPINYRISS